MLATSGHVGLSEFVATGAAENLAPVKVAAYFFSVASQYFSAPGAFLLLPSGDRDSRPRARFSYPGDVWGTAGECSEG